MILFYFNRVLDFSAGLTTGLPHLFCIHGARQTSEVLAGGRFFTTLNILTIYISELLGWPIF